MSFDERYIRGDLTILDRRCSQSTRRKGWTRLELIHKLKELTNRRSDLHTTEFHTFTKHQLCRALFDRVRAYPSIFRIFDDVRLRHSSVQSVDVPGYRMHMIWFCIAEDSHCTRFYHGRTKAHKLLQATAPRLILLNLKAFLENEEEKDRLRAWLGTEDEIALGALEDAMDNNAQSGLGYYEYDSDMNVREFAHRVFDVLYQTGPGYLDAKRDDDRLPEEALVPLSHTFVVPHNGPKKNASWKLKSMVGNVIEVSDDTNESHLFRKVSKDEWKQYPYRAHMAEMSLGVAALLKDYCKHREYDVDGWYQEDLAFPHVIHASASPDFDGKEKNTAYTAFFMDANEILVWNLDKIHKWSIGGHRSEDWYGIRGAVFEAAVDPCELPHCSYHATSSKNVHPSVCSGVVRSSPYKTCKDWQTTLPAEDADEDDRFLLCAMAFRSIDIDVGHVRWDTFYSKHRANLGCVLRQVSAVSIMIPDGSDFVLQRLHDIGKLIETDTRLDLEYLSMECTGQGVNFISSSVLAVVLKRFNTRGRFVLTKIHFEESETFNSEFICDAVDVFLKIYTFGDEKVYLKPFLALVKSMPNIKHLSLFGCSLNNFYDPGIWYDIMNIISVSIY